MTRTSLLIVLVALLAACGGSSGPEPAARAQSSVGETPAARAQPAALESWLVEAPAAANLDRAQLIARFGAPARTTANPVPNRHDPAVTDTLVELEYDDARYQYYVMGAGRELLDFAEVRDNAHLALTTPGIGTPADSIRAWWGEPVTRGTTSIEYDCASCEVPHPATFEIENGVVRAIRFDFYVD